MLIIDIKDNEISGYRSNENKYNTPTDDGNIEVSRSDDCSIAHGLKCKFEYID